jgi:glycosyltransferase involved in cell wall biosynthesis
MCISERPRMQKDIYKQGSRLSVLMSVYNCETYLTASIESILNQSFRDFTFIIVDDGSVDSSLAILKQYERSEPRIRLISRPNTGLVGALNEALSMAESEYVARMDGDDISMRDRFARQIEFLDANREYIAVGCHCLWVDPSGLPLKVFPQHMVSAEIDAELLSGNGNAITHAASMYRRRDLIAAGKYKEQYETAEDLDLFLRLAERGQLTSLPDVLYVYRQHPASINHSQAVKQELATRLAVQDARRRRLLPHSDEDVRISPKPKDLAALYRRWTGFALEGCNVATARKYAYRLARLKPLSRYSWRLLAKSYMPRPISRFWCKLKQCK